MDTITRNKHNSSRNTSRNHIGGDAKLIPRVREYLHSCKKDSPVDIHKMAEFLRSKHREYKRKKWDAFKGAVARAYDIIFAEELFDGEEESPSQIDERIEGDNSSDDSEFSTDNTNYSVVEDGNFANASLRDLYVKKEKSFAIAGSPRQHSTPAPIKTVNLSKISPSVINSSTVSADEPYEKGSNGYIVEKEGAVDNKISITPVPLKKRKSTTKPGSFRETPDAKKRKKIGDTIVQKPIVTFADIGGNEKCVEEMCKLLVHLKHPEVYSQLCVPPPRGLLLHGPPGCGKTLLANAIAGELDLPFLKIAATEIVSGVSGESEEKIRELFGRAVSSAPCVLFIDEIDSITPKRETAQREMERRIVAQLLTCMDDLNSMDISTQVLVIGATNRPDSLDPALRRAGRFDREISLGIPDMGARARILEVLCRKLRLSSDVDFKNLAVQTPGYVGADLMALTREAAMSAVNRIFQSMEETALLKSKNPEKSSDTVTVISWLREQPPLTTEQLSVLYIESQDFAQALKVVQPSAKREGFATVPDVTWEDVGALQSIRDELQLTILAPIRYPDKFSLLGLSSPAGILLCGPPGCGKTLLAKAIANESGINFISVKGPELLNMYVGESERAVRQCFQRARSSAPCIIFFDELDALCSHRSDSVESGSGSRVVNQLLTEMDGVEGRAGVFILGATNRPDIIDPAVLRPGRLDKILYVGLPKMTERVEILKTITKNGTKPPLDTETSLKDIGMDTRCTGFTGADLSALVREASFIAMKEFMVNCKIVSDDVIKVKQKHFDEAFGRVRLSVSEKQQAIYENVRMKYCSPGAHIAKKSDAESMKTMDLTE